MKSYRSRRHTALVRMPLLCFLALVLSISLTACDLSALYQWLPSSSDSALETPFTEDAWQADVTSTEELYHHMMYAASEGYPSAVLHLQLPQAIPISSLSQGHVIRFVGNALEYYILEGEDSDTLQDQTVLLHFPDSASQARHWEKSDIAAQTVFKWRNASTVLRQRAIKSSPHRRGEEFTDFAITRENAGTMPVHSSEQLWIALEKNYLPTFPPNEETAAEQLWQMAADVLRAIITEDMDTLQKLRAIFDYLCETVQYHHPLAAAAGSHREDAEHFPGGVLEHHLAVCDGIAKTAVILCRMEGIPCLMIEGTGENGGHAWNAVEYEGSWYTLCATYGMMEADADAPLAQTLGGPLGWTSYRTFMAPLSYMDERFPEQQLDHPLPDTDRSAAVPFPSDHPDIHGLGIDFHIESMRELEHLFATLVREGLRKQYYMELTTSTLPLDLDMLLLAARQSDPLIDMTLFAHTDEIGMHRYTVFVQ